MQVAIVVYPGMTALDAIGPYEVLNNLEGRELRFVWKEPGPIVTDSGALALGATHGFDECPSPDLVLVPGSSGATIQTMAEKPLLDWLRSVHPGARFTTSVCSGALILGAAGLLEGRPATTHWMAMEQLKRFGAEARPAARIVRSDKVWTAAGVSAGIDLALALMAEIEGPERAQEAQLLIEYDPRPPFDSGHISKASPAVIKAAKRRMRGQAFNIGELAAVPGVLARRWLKARAR